jgi:hypothetical protein
MVGVVPRLTPWGYFLQPMKGLVPASSLVARGGCRLFVLTPRATWLGSSLRGQIAGPGFAVGHVYVGFFSGPY